MIYFFNKKDRSPFAKNLNEVKAIADSANVLMNIANTVRTKTKEIMSLVTTKPKSFFKRIFSTKSN